MIFQRIPGIFTAAELVMMVMFITILMYDQPYPTQKQNQDQDLRNI